jgi:hypothetical protein
MKMSTQDYQMLRNAIETAGNVEKVGSDMRYRWDLFWHAMDTAQRENVEVYKRMCELYAYLEDDHIDTALRRIVFKNELETE